MYFGLRCYLNNSENSTAKNQYRRNLQSHLKFQTKTFEKCFTPQKWLGLRPDKYISNVSKKK